MTTKKAMIKKTNRTVRPGSRTIRLFNPARVSSDECARAALVFNYTHESTTALLKAYDLARADRAGGSQARRGMTTDEEQDLLRAMLVTATSGLDSMLKQLIGDVLPRIAHNDAQVRRGLERFLSRKMRLEIEVGEQTRYQDFLARVLASPHPTETVIKEYVTELKSHSLQSVEELARTASAFALQPNDVGIDFESLRPIFDARNKIIHELDINLDSPRRNRNMRQKTTMINQANMLLEVGEKILVAVDRKVRAL